MLKISKGFSWMLILTAFTAALSSITVMAGQQQERIVEKLSRKEPVKILSIKTKKRALKLGLKFPDDDDWLRGCTIRVGNTSGKTIKFISIELSFPRPEDEASAQEPPLSHTITYGRMLPAPGETALPDQSKRIRPGDTINLALPDSEYDGLKSFLQSLNYPTSIKRLKIRIEDVLFDDDTMWHAGMLLRRDPDNPERWIPIRQTGNEALHNHSKSARDHPSRSRKRRPRNITKEDLLTLQAASVNSQPVQLSQCQGHFVHTGNVSCPLEVGCTA